jgi:HSP20 family molecular chaperone IbpA
MTRNKDSDIHTSHYNKFENKISRLFDDFMNDVGFTRIGHGSRFRGNTDSKPTWSPAIDIVENEREYIITADVPGVKKEDIDIELHDSVLVLSGQHGQDIPSTAQAQEINIDKDNQPQHNNKYPQSQYQQQPPQPQQYQQQPPQPQQYQQPPPPQQSSDAQKYQQSVDQYNEQQSTQQQSTEQQPNGPQQYQHIKRRHHQESGEKFHVQERPYGYFSRSVQLPSNIRTDDDFYASLENGVLTIRIPKSNEKPKKKIAIS